MPDKPDLLACPFCEGIKLQVSGGTAHSSDAWVECSTCYAEGPYGCSEIEAIALWNYRPIEERVYALEEVMHSAQKAKEPTPSD